MLKSVIDRYKREIRKMSFFQMDFKIISKRLTPGIGIFIKVKG